MPIQTSVPSLATGPSSGTTSPTLLVAASIRTTDWMFSTPTQTPPGPAVMICGPAGPAGPTGIVATMRLVAGSTRVTDPSCCSATHTDPAVTATPEGADPTGIVATTLPVTGSILTRTLFSQSVCQTAPAPVVS
jgi:hypothetical protein